MFTNQLPRSLYSAIMNDNEIPPSFIYMAATLASRFPSFSELLETVRYYWFLYTLLLYQGYRYMCTWVDSFFERVYAHTSVCLRREVGGWTVSFTHRSVVARCERDDESFRLSFSNRLDFTGHQAKENVYMTQAPSYLIDLCSFWLKTVVFAFPFVHPFRSITFC